MSTKRRVEEEVFAAVLLLQLSSSLFLLDDSSDLWSVIVELTELKRCMGTVDVESSMPIVVLFFSGGSGAISGPCAFTKGLLLVCDVGFGTSGSVPLLISCAERVSVVCGAFRL